MLQRRLGPPRRLSPGLPSLLLLPLLVYPRALQTSTNPPIHAPTRGETPGCKLLPEPCQVGAQVLDTCVYTSGLHACMRVQARNRGKKVEQGAGGKRARMFLDSVAPHYYVPGQRETEREGGGK